MSTYQPKGSLQKEALHDVGRMRSPEQVKNCKRAACRVFTKTSAGSGVLIDGRSVGFPHACLLTNEHVIGTPEQAASATIFFNYQGSDYSKWLEAELDPSSCFDAHKELDVSIVALKTDTTDDPNTDMSRLSEPRTLDDAKNDHKRPRCPAPVSLNRKAAASIIKGEPMTIWQHPGSVGYRESSLWNIKSVTENNLDYLNHTERGSSGSPIYDHNSDLIGIHCEGGT